MKAVAVLLIAGLALTSASIPKAKISPKVDLDKIVQMMKAKSIGCDICTFIVTQIDKLLVDENNIDTIVTEVEKLCSGLDGIFPGSGAACNEIVETYLPQIIEGLVNNQLAPSAVCGTIGLCP